MNEASGILQRLPAEPQKAAAMFRNRVTTMQHAELWRDALTRVIQGDAKKPPREAAALVREYFTAPAG
jgi:hypothetical protein